MFISNVDAGLERMLRERVPLPEDVGDVAFDPPTGTWSAQLSRITVNLFLYDVQRSSHPARSATVQQPDGQPLMRRRPQPMVRLGYMVSAWAGSPRDEHQLLGDVISLLAGIDHVPPHLFPTPPMTSVHVSLGDDRSLPRELWVAAGGHLKASATLQLHVGADSFDWEQAAPPVERIRAMAERMEEA